MSQDSNPLASCSNKRNLLLPAKISSTFFLMHAYVYRQHTTSPSFTHSIMINTQLTHTTFRFTSVRLPLSHTVHKRQDSKLTDIERATDPRCYNPWIRVEINGRRFIIISRFFRCLIKILLSMLHYRTMRSGEFCMDVLKLKGTVFRRVRNIAKADY